MPRHHALPPGVLAVDYLFPADREAEAFLLLRRILGRAGWRWDLLDLVRLESTPSVGAALRKRLSRAERRELMRHQSGGTRSSLDMQVSLPTWHDFCVIFAVYHFPGQPSLCKAMRANYCTAVLPGIKSCGKRQLKGLISCWMKSTTQLTTIGVHFSSLSSSQ